MLCPQVMRFQYTTGLMFPPRLHAFFFSEYQRSVGETSGAVRLRKRNGALRSCIALIPSPRLSCFLSHSTVFIFKMAASSYPHMAGMGRITFYIGFFCLHDTLKVLICVLHTPLLDLVCRTL